MSGPAAGVTHRHFFHVLEFSSRFQIAVVGGGIVGKACALLLAQQGMQVALAAPGPLRGARRGR
jgi:glycine/D-amino acid oxidase-like deaminating enzyme